MFPFQEVPPGLLAPNFTTKSPIIAFHQIHTFREFQNFGMLPEIDLAVSLSTIEKN